MSVKPILFNTEMVKTILEGRKTCTRRIVKPQPTYNTRSGFSWKGYAYGTDLSQTKAGAAYIFIINAPYHLGDVLYVRETWSEWTGGYLYKAWPEPFPQPGQFPGTKWSPSIHMPKEAARIWLKVTGVRVERLQEINIDGIRNEGLESMAVHAGDIEMALKEWEILWNSTIKKSDLDRYGWNANPWVWVIEFERCDKPESEE